MSGAGAWEGAALSPRACCIPPPTTCMHSSAGRTARRAGVMPPCLPAALRAPPCRRDLSCANCPVKLRGTILPQVAYLDYLVNLDLSHNELSGTLPELWGMNNTCAERGERPRAC